MSDKLKRFENLVNREMDLLRAAEEPALDADRSERLKAAIREEAMRLGGPRRLALMRRARQWVAAAAIVLAMGLSWQLQTSSANKFDGTHIADLGAFDDPSELLSDWGAALDISAASAGRLVSEPWLPDEWISPSEAAGELDELLDGFDRAFESGA